MVRIEGAAITAAIEEAAVLIEIEAATTGDSKTAVGLHPDFTKKDVIK